MMSRRLRNGGLLLAAGLLVAVAGLVARTPVRASDHADTVENANRPGADISDVFIFPSATAGNVVLAMDVNPLIPSGQYRNVSFDPNVLYQFRIDVNGDKVEDYVIQAKFNGTGSTQQVLIAGPVKPPTTGTTSYFGRRLPTTGTINTAFSPTAGMTVFAGPREDPFFFDLNRFFQLFPDRASPLTGTVIANPNTPQPPVSFRGFPANSFGGDTSPSSDFLAGFNVLSIVVDLPRSMLSNNGTLGPIGVWCTTSVYSNAPNYNYTQQDRLSRPVINEVFATVANQRHHVNNFAIPTEDNNPNNLISDVDSYLQSPAGRGAGVRSTIESIVVPDVMMADLSKTTGAGYLGYEVSGGFGGRLLTDDVVDTSLMIVFGQTIPTLFPATQDNVNIMKLTTDNTGSGAKHFTPSTFPYFGPPQ